MPDLPNWRHFVVPQRHGSGCVPTGYEWLVRYLGIQGVNLGTFQEDFDLGREYNNFVSVSSKIKSIYPYINFRISDFPTGLEKINAIKSLLKDHIPCLISLALPDIENGQLVHKGWHIMPVVYIDDEKIKMIHHATTRGNEVWEFPLQQIIWIHDNMEGGKDIAWIIG